MIDRVAGALDVATIRWMAAMWAEAVYTQNVRLEDALDRYQSALADEGFRESYEGMTDPDLRAAWESTYREATGQLTPHIAWGLGLAKYFFLLAVAQLDKCVDLLPDDGLRPFPDRTLLRKLRNFEEHWEDPTGASATWLRNRIPDIAPGRLTYTKKHTWIEGMEVTAIVLWAQEVDVRVRKNAAQAGDALPPSEWDDAIHILGRTLGGPQNPDRAA